MAKYTNQSPAAAQQLDSCLSQARAAALKQGRPWIAEAVADSATGEFRLTIVVGPQAPQAAPPVEPALDVPAVETPAAEVKPKAKRP